MKKLKFNNKKDYEDELVRLLLLSSNQKEVDKKLTKQQYDELLDEYLTFCSTE
jgi:hypothetical protein